MGAALDDAAVFHQQDQVGAATVERRWAMTNVVRPASRAAIDAWMSCSLSVSRLLVGFVEDQDLRRRQDRPRDRQALLLSAGELDAALADERLVAARAARSMNSWALARRAASSTSASVASWRP